MSVVKIPLNFIKYYAKNEKKRLIYSELFKEIN